MSVRESLYTAWSGAGHVVTGALQGKPDVSADTSHLWIPIWSAHYYLWLELLLYLRSYTVQSGNWGILCAYSCAAICCSWRISVSAWKLLMEVEHFIWGCREDWNWCIGAALQTHLSCWNWCCVHVVVDFSFHTNVLSVHCSCCFQSLETDVNTETGW